MSSSSEPIRQTRQPVRLPAFWLGFTLAGFFDGILLHQVLQWHHLLSNLEGVLFRDQRVQIAADGYFHVLMYFLLGFAMWLLWRRREALASPGAGARVLQFLLVGFGAWQWTDVVLFHWILGIHNVRVGVENPLVWDVGWLVIFGVAPLLIAWFMRGHMGGGPGRRTAAAAIILTCFAGGWAARPPADQPDAPVTIVYAPWVKHSDAFAATTDRSDALVSAAPGVYVVTGISAKDALALYANGALFISNRGFPRGCFSTSPPRM